MKRFAIRLGGLPLLIAFCSFFMCSLVGAEEPLSLSAYYQAALQRSETAAIQLQQIDQAEERYRQANAALRPTIRGEVNYTWQDPLPAGSPSTLSSLTQQRTSRISASQPLFRGMREYAALRQSRDLLAAQRQDYRQARVALYLDIVRNYYTILALESDLANYQEEIRLNQRQARDIQTRVRIGRSRDSELLNQRSTISTLQASMEQLRGQLRVAREVFAFLSGLDANTRLQDDRHLPEQLQPVTQYLAGIMLRPDVHAAGQRLTAAAEGMAIARGEGYPSLDLIANYYLQRPGYLENSKWDVTLLLTVPLYSGGTVQSRVREAGAIRNQAELTRGLVLRQARQAVRSLYQSLESNLSQLKALAKATRAARKSYAAQLRDFRLGLVTNLEVLQALTEYQQNQRSLAHIRYTAKSNYLQLLAASAQLPLADQQR